MTEIVYNRIFVVITNPGLESELNPRILDILHNTYVWDFITLAYNRAEMYPN